MFLYKVEIHLEHQLVFVIVLADNDEKAFEYAEANLARHFIKTPAVEEMLVVEKKRVEKGSGYVIETKEQP